MTYPATSIIIVNWNGLRFLPNCLKSLANQTYHDFEVVLVDNGSADRSVSYVRENHPDVRLVCLSSNEGFAAGNNAGIAEARGEYVVTLNNDTEAEPGWLEAIVSAAQGDPSVGMVASTMLFAHRPDLIASAGIQVGRDAVALDRLVLARADRRAPARPVDVLGPSAGAALYRRAMLDDVGVFDAGYFAYLEDVDLALRARLRRWRCVWSPEARVLHVYSGTAGQDSPFKRYLMARNRIWTIVKDFPTGLLIRCLPSILVYDCLALSHAVATGAWSSVRGRVRPVPDMPSLLAKRRAVQSRRLATDREMWALLTPVSSAFNARSLQRRLNQVLAEGKGEPRPAPPGEVMDRE